MRRYAAHTSKGRVATFKNSFAKPKAKPADPTPAGFTRIAPDTYADSTTGRFVVRRTEVGWSWYDQHRPGVGGPLQGTLEAALADLARHDAARGASDILAGWAKLGGR